MSWLTLPLTNESESTQTFALEGTNYIVRTRYNERAGAWFMDVFDDAENLLMAGRKLTVNWYVAGIREAAASVPPGWFVCIDTRGEDIDPTLEDLGTRVLLYYVESA